MHKKAECSVKKKNVLAEAVSLQAAACAHSSQGTIGKKETGAQEKRRYVDTGPEAEREMTRK